MVSYRDVSRKPVTQAVESIAPRLNRNCRRHYYAAITALVILLLSCFNRNLKKNYLSIKEHQKKKKMGRPVINGNFVNKKTDFKIHLFSYLWYKNVKKQ